MKNKLDSLMPMLTGAITGSSLSVMTGTDVKMLIIPIICSVLIFINNLK